MLGQLRSCMELDLRFEHQLVGAGSLPGKGKLDRRMLAVSEMARIRIIPNRTSREIPHSRPTAVQYQQADHHARQRSSVILWDFAFLYADGPNFLIDEGWDRPIYAHSGLHGS